MNTTKGSYRITVKIDNGVYRLTRIWFGSDGSYYVGTPVPTPGEARLFKMTVDYTEQETSASLSEVVDLAQPKAATKKSSSSHHPDGFGSSSSAGQI